MSSSHKHTRDSILDSTHEKSPPLDQVSKLQLERDEYLNGWKRALADYENYKKEQQKRSHDHHNYQVASFFRELLPLFDTLSQTMSHIPPDQTNKGWYQGLQALHKQWKQFLDSNGITPIESEGKEFNPELHEALAIENNPKAPDNSILSVASEGYILKDQIVLRPAKVIVNQITNNT
jgi:molecular chaperone GrpE